MPFVMSVKDDIIIFKLDSDFTETDFNKILTILDRLLDKKEPFLFLIDALDIKSAPIKCSMVLIKWMSEKKDKIPGILCGSAIVLSYPRLITVINYVFKKRKPISPNLITMDLKKGLDFLNKLKI